MSKFLMINNQFSVGILPGCPMHGQALVKWFTLELGSEGWWFKTAKPGLSCCVVSLSDHNAASYVHVIL